jgi:tRNA-Thr(GGU) m(6)t(6)A37 methyltransferase TsaA
VLGEDRALDQLTSGGARQEPGDEERGTEQEQLVSHRLIRPRPSWVSILARADLDPAPRVWKAGAMTTDAVGGRAEARPDAEWSVRPIGWVTSTRAEVIDDDWGPIEATITLVEPYGPASILGLEAFSHLEVIYLFDRVDPGSIHTGSRLPRNNPAWPEVGIFAQRVKNRPNRLGLSTCELVAVDGVEVRVRGLDAVDGTPVIDLKPFMSEFGPRTDVVQPTWSCELMQGYF